ncbi:hypothetical protein LV716_09000 [Flagellimonas sp. HMM57]|uniref:hypothetical protein n=1 Tax=unclassified Flagellimonas TaxID=2644544 RepID=UPI0013D6E7FF|nr:MULTISPECIES: hypothetical protein [unclassified Flagellimonas]UII77891.1 hypothetical protein LV716_09000 [Flagellimonas sp. HMM57]
MQAAERDSIICCITLIERRFFPEQFALGEKPRQRDLEYLIELMEEKSNIRISLSTMKRLWKNEFNQIPHLNTLNALASLIDYDSWNAFRQDENTVVKTSLQKPSTRSLPIKKYALFSLLGVLVFISAFIFISNRNKPISIPDNIIFSANKTVAHNVPNSVIFSYDLKGIEADSFFIQRSWNPTHKKSIDPSKKTFSEMYYYPGFHWARLIANDEVIKKIRINVKTDGWFATAKANRLDSIPFYPDQSQLINDGSFRVGDNIFENSKIDINKGLIVSYFNIREFSGLLSGEYILETRVKFDAIAGIVCPYMEVKVIDEKSSCWLGITDKGCVSNLNIKVGDTILAGTENDFSTLGTDLSEWQDIRLESSNGRFKYFLNDALAIDEPFEDDRGKVMGLILTFTGKGAVDFVRLKNGEGEVVYTEGFDN